MTYNTLSIEDILHGYQRTRLSNKRILQQRKDDIYRTIPSIQEIDEQISASYIKAARLRISGDTASSEALQAECRGLTDRKKQLLEENGYPSDYLDEIFTCSACRDTGFVDGEKCSCFMEHIIDSLYLQSNLKNVLQKENFTTFSMEYYSKELPVGREYSPYDNMNKILTRTKEFVHSFDTKKDSRGNLLLYGETGLGKTFLTNCIAKELLDGGHSVLYLSANELFESVLAEYLMNRKTELEDLYKYIYNSELLIIDDLGTELTNNFVLSQLFEIINKRDITLGSTLISTNLSMKQLRDRYSERIMSRIIANYTVFNIYGDNIRYQKRKKAINAST